MIKTMLFIIMIIFTEIIIAPLGTRNTLMSTTERPAVQTNTGTSEVIHRINITRTIQLNKSYYIEKIKLFYTRDVLYYNSLIYGYFVSNIDNDKYPDIILWRLKNISVWSYKRGIYASIKTKYYYDRPIIMDLNSDGVTDYIIIVEHSSYDAQTYYRRYRNRIWTVIYKWYPLNGSLIQIAKINAHASSKTSVIIGDYIVLPTIINLYSWPYWGYFILTVGIVIINIDTGNSLYYELGTFKLSTSSYLYTNDLSTTYESYIYKLDHQTVVVIPQGLDKIYVIKLFPAPSLIKTIDLQDPNTLNDRLIILPQTVFYHCPAAHSVSTTSIKTKYYYWPPRISDILLDNDIIIIPYGTFYYLSPNDQVTGYFPRVDDKDRSERLTGIAVVDLNNGTVKKISLLGKRLGAYTIRAITSVYIPDHRTIYLGVIAQYTKTSNQYNVIRVLILRLSTNDTWSTWSYSYIHSVPVAYYHTRGLPIIPVTSNVFLSSSYIYIEDVLVPYHITRTRPDYPTPLYYYAPILAHNVTYIDIDGDEYPEYLTVVQYQRTSNSCRGQGPICYMPPYVYGGGAWLVIFKHPRITIQLSGTKIVGGTLRANITVYTTPISRTTLEIINNNTVLNSTSISGAGNYSVTLVLKEPGEYVLSVVMNTRYYVYGSVIDTSGSKQLVSFVENISIPLVTAQYLTKIILLKPEYNVLTPNSYTNGLLVEAILKYYNPSTSGWINTSPVQSLELIITPVMADSIYTLVLDSSTNTYKATIQGLGPSAYNITIRFRGYGIYASSVNTTRLYLEKYRVVFRVHIPSRVPALTSPEIMIKTYYRLIVGGEWVTKALQDGLVDVKASNSSIMLIKAGNNVIFLPRSIMLPPQTTVSLSYIPPSGLANLYTNLTTNISIRVESLEISVSPLRLRYFKDTMLRVFETSENFSRNISSSFKAILKNDTSNISLRTGNSIIYIDYPDILPGNYTLIVMPTSNIVAYSSPIYYFNISILPPRLWMSIDIDPLIPVNNSHTTYALVPVNITPIIVSPVLRISGDPIIYIDNRGISIKPNTTITTSFKKPGIHNITLSLDYYGSIMNYSINITIIPHPVKIIIELIDREGISIKTVDLLGRMAPGNISLSILHGQHVIYTKSLTTKGKLIVDMKELAYSSYLVKAAYKGNESYAPGTNRTFLRLDPIIEPLPEPVVPSILLILLILVLFRDNRSRDKDHGFNR